MNVELNEAVRKAALSVKVGRNITGEYLRVKAENTGTTTTTPSDWGRAVSKLISTGLLTSTGAYERAVSKQARGRKVPVYTRNSARVAVAA